MLDAATRERIHTPHPDTRSHLGCYCNSPRIGWIVAVTQPQAEAWAETNLTRRGYRTYLPRYAVRRRDLVLPTNTRIILAPLWPGYLFVHHDSRDSWRPIYETPGIRSVLKHRDQIQWVRAGAVEAVEALEDARRHLPADNAQWAPGTPVALRRGYAMEGLPAVVLAVVNNSVRIAVMFLGQLREITVDANCLRARDND